VSHQINRTNHKISEAFQTPSATVCQRDLGFPGNTLLLKIRLYFLSLPGSSENIVQCHFIIPMHSVSYDCLFLENKISSWLLLLLGHTGISTNTDY